MNELKPAGASPVDLRLGLLVEAAEKHADNYSDDDRQDIRCDVLNAFYAGAKFAQAAERERCAKLCAERAQLSWAAADQPYAAEVKMQHEAVAAAMEELAGELRA